MKKSRLSDILLGILLLCSNGGLLADEANTNVSQERRWICEGPIYETHPDYYSGRTLKDLVKAIPAIARLGVKTIHLLPFWEHKMDYVYMVLDNYKIDPRYGNREDLKILVDRVHQYDMRILFDLVTCCTQKGAVIYNEGWVFRVPLSKLQGMGLRHFNFQGADCVRSTDLRGGSRTAEFAGIVDGKEVIPFAYPRPGWGVAIDRTNPEVIDYFAKMCAYYVEEYHIDGWRVDAPPDNWNPKIVLGDHSILPLLREARKRMMAVRPDVILVAENPTRGRELEGAPVLDEVCDIASGYYLYRRMGRYGSSRQMIGSSKELVNVLHHERVWYNRRRTAHLETHDTQRINKKSPRLNRAALVLISTLPAIPYIQAGQEIGAVIPYESLRYSAGRGVDWDKGNDRLREFYRRVFAIRRQSTALKYGSIRDVWRSGDRVYAYRRSYRGEEVIVVLNFGGREATAILNLAFLAAGATLDDELNGKEFGVDEPGAFEIVTPAYGSRILVLKESASF